MLKAVIFDMDGVIIDSEPLHLEVCIDLFKKLGLNFCEKEYSTFIGVSNTSMWTTLKEKYNLKQSLEELVEIQAKANLDCIKGKDISPIAGVRELLSELKSNNIKIALASSSPVEGIELVLSKFNIREYFSDVVSGEGLKRGKPAPDIFLKAAELIGIEPENCAVVEDSNHGVSAAKAAGMKCLGFQNTNSGNQDISKADVIVNTMREVNLCLLKGLF